MRARAGCVLPGCRQACTQANNEAAGVPHSLSHDVIEYTVLDTHMRTWCGSRLKRRRASCSSSGCASTHSGGAELRSGSGSLKGVRGTASMQGSQQLARARTRSVEHMGSSFACAGAAVPAASATAISAHSAQDSIIAVRRMRNAVRVIMGRFVGRTAAGTAAGPVGVVSAWRAPGRGRAGVTGAARLGVTVPSVSLSGSQPA